MFNIEDERLLIDNLINNEDDSRIQTIAKISDQHTFNAKGINIDYILYLEQVENKSYKVQKFPIFKFFDEIFLTVSKYAVVFKILCHSPKLCKKQGMTPCKTLTLTKP